MHRQQRTVIAISCSVPAGTKLEEVAMAGCSPSSVMRYWLCSQQMKWISGCWLVANWGHGESVLGGGGYQLLPVSPSNVIMSSQSGPVWQTNSCKSTKSYQNSSILINSFIASHISEKMWWSPSNLCWKYFQRNILWKFFRRNFPFFFYFYSQAAVIGGAEGHTARN